MRLSTGIILSILSANVFAIEHLNDVHSSSLLARRAVMADTDGVFLQKRGDDEGKKKQAKSKHSLASNSGKGRPTYTNPAFEGDSDSESSSSDDAEGGFTNLAFEGDDEGKKKPAKSKSSPVPNSGKGGHAYTNPAFEGDSDSESNSNDGAEERSTNLAANPSPQDRGATGGNENVHTKVDSDQEGSGFVDVIGGLPYQLINYFRKKFNRGAPKSGLISGKDKALAASQKTATEFGGETGESIGTELYEMLKYALETAWSYQEMYNNPAKSLFDLKLPSTVLDGPKGEYESLRKEAPERIKLYIMAIEDIIKKIFTTPENMINDLYKIMWKTNAFNTFILDMVFRYTSLLELLEISDDTRIQEWNAHLEDIRTYKLKLASCFKRINQMVEDAPQSPNQQGLSRFSSSMLGFRNRRESKAKSPKGGASHSALSSGGVSNPAFSDDE
ncbi:hypothetical protein BASA50_007888 [Batrachochytrium salamandrivorans]|uniref:Uncharacterized protein n=1 Tax=Batrachochytrium salamandrivorans TaxID=1357716 RepID=A0ABQ8F5Q9_9FUNG|nr:hypothetical protein BASA50_007888 [Batrachochytrium salamandrivorans]KAH9255666.1 hypothetical protein BASA81_006272 [Batrachochytrium salamandrivorans]